MKIVTCQALTLLGAELLGERGVADAKNGKEDQTKAIHDWMQSLWPILAQSIITTKTTTTKEESQQQKQHLLNSSTTTTIPAAGSQQLEEANKFVRLEQTTTSKMW